MSVSHPHREPRQPRNGSVAGTNPPVFAWLPQNGQNEFTLRVATDTDFKDQVLVEYGLPYPVFLPYRALKLGRYYWCWESLDFASPVFEFEISIDSVTLEVPGAETWLERFPAAHPRLYIQPEEIEALRESRNGERSHLWADLQAAADDLLHETHEMTEPPYLPDEATDYTHFFQVWYKIAMDARRFLAGARTLALAYQASGHRPYGEAAAHRLTSVSLWDPMGPSRLDHNDEAHMSVIWNGPFVADWAWDCFTDSQRALVIEQFRHRGEITFEHMHNRGSYGVTRFDSHAGREIVFLAMLALVFHEQIPDARGWLDWLRPVLCGIWPIWAGDDGAWAEGLAYGLGYVSVMAMFASALKSGTGINLYQRPFWRNHARWRKDCMPYYAEWMGFGDHTEPWEFQWLESAGLIDLIGRETGVREFTDYTNNLRAYASRFATPEERKTPGMDPLTYLHAPTYSESVTTAQEPSLRVYPDGGWAAIRTHPNDAKQDIAFVFRSSLYGSISHSHANHNDFILHVAGHCVAMPSGYFDGYASPHHADWVWHTKSHNCITLSDAGQLMRSYEARGSIENPYEDEQIAYLLGNADAAYADRASYCRRHVLFLKRHKAFLFVDEFRARPEIISTLQWNLHSCDKFEIDETNQTFRVGPENARINGHCLTHLTSYFTLSEGWNPMPLRTDPLWPQQYHLRFTVTVPTSRRILGVLLSAELPSVVPPSVKSFREEATEGAWIGDDLVLIDQGSGIRFGEITSSGIVLLRLDGIRYDIDDNGIHKMP